MKFFAVSAALVAVVLAQDASVTSTALTPQQSCLAECSPTDVNCQAICVGVPHPGENQMGLVTDCVANCDQGDGSTEQSEAYGRCRDACISSYIITSGTAAPGGAYTTAPIPGVPTSAAASSTGSAAAESGAAASGSGEDTLVFVMPISSLEDDRLVAANATALTFAMWPIKVGGTRSFTITDPEMASAMLEGLEDGLDEYTGAEPASASATVSSESTETKTSHGEDYAQAPQTSTPAAPSTLSTAAASAPTDASSIPPSPAASHTRTAPAFSTSWFTLPTAGSEYIAPPSAAAPTTSHSMGDIASLAGEKGVSSADSSSSASMSGSAASASSTGEANAAAGMVGLSGGVLGLVLGFAALL